MKKSIGEMIVEYIRNQSEHNDKIDGLTTVIDNILDKDENIKSVMYNDITEYTDEVDDETIKAIVEKLRRRDGTLSGVRWSMEETCTLATQYDVENKTKLCGKIYSDIKFWFAMNYVFAVHYSITRTINGFVELAIDEMCNKNVCFDDIIKRIFEKI